MAEILLWRQIDKAQQSSEVPSKLRTTDHCYYFMDYTSEGYKKNESNRRVINFKKTLEREGRSEWTYKKEAIGQFAQNLEEFLQKFDFGAMRTVLIPVPCSKKKTDPLYDDRLMRVCYAAGNAVGVVVYDGFDMSESIQASHYGGTRKVDELKRFMTFDAAGFQGVPDVVFLVDDVITSGAHFVACSDILAKHYQDSLIIGVFWAKRLSLSYDYGMNGF